MTAGYFQLKFHSYQFKMKKLIKQINVEGITLPNTSLTNLDLIDAAKQLKIINFIGVFTRDLLPHHPKSRECGIINLDSSDRPGTHWCCWWKVRKDIFYFDSYGLLPPTELQNYFSNEIYYNSTRVQPDNQVFCGHLCLYVLKRLDVGNDFQMIINTLF